MALPKTVIAPVAAILPLVLMLPPVTLPAALTSPLVTKFCPATLPDALIVPVEIRLPPVVFPLTVNEVKVPTLVKLEFNTLELSVFPVICAAGALDVTPVSWLPLPINNPPEVMLPVAEIVVLASRVPCTVAPVPDTTNTLATLAALTLTVESCTI